MNLSLLLTIILCSTIRPVAIHKIGTYSNSSSADIIHSHGTAAPASYNRVLTAKPEFLEGVSTTTTTTTDPPVPLCQRGEETTSCSLSSISSFDTCCPPSFPRPPLRSIMKKMVIRNSFERRDKDSWSSMALRLEINICLLYQEIMMMFRCRFSRHPNHPPKHVKKQLPGIKRKRWESMIIAFSKNDLLKDIFYRRCNQRSIASVLDMVFCDVFNYIIVLTEYYCKLFRFWVHYIIIMARYHLNCRWQNICSRLRVLHLKCRLFVLVARCSSFTNAMQVTRASRFDVERSRHSWKTIAFIYAYAYLVAQSQPLCDIEPAMCGDASALHFIWRTLVTKIITSGFGVIVAITAVGFYLYRQLPSTVEEALARLQKIGICVNGGGSGTPSPQEQVIQKTRKRGPNPYGKLLFILLVLNLPTLTIAPSINASGAAAAAAAASSSIVPTIAAVPVGVMVAQKKAEERRRKAEEAWKKLCDENGGKYEPPPPGESAKDQHNRRRRIKKSCETVAQQAERKLKEAECQRKKRGKQSPEEKATEAKRKKISYHEGGGSATRGKKYQLEKKEEEDTFNEKDILQNDDVPHIKVSLDGVEEARKLLLRTGIDGSGDHSGNHRAIGCTVCDEFIIGTEELCWITKEELLEYKDRISVDMYQECYCGGTHMDEVLIKQYEVKGCEGMLLSRRFGKDDSSVCMVCSKCKHSLRQRNSKATPRFAIANGNAIGTIPSTIVFDGGDGELKSLKTIKEVFDENGNSIPNQSESLVTSVMAAAIAPIRPYAYIFSYRGGQHQTLVGNFQFFELDQTKVAGALDCLHRSGNSSNIYVVLNGRMTPTQKDIVRKKAELDIGLYFGLLRWFKEHHSAYKDVPLGDATSPLKVQLIEDPSSDANTDDDKPHDPNENRDDGATFYFSGGRDPTTDTSVYKSSKDLVMALLKEHSAPTLTIHGGNYASHSDVKKLEDVFPTVFPFGSGGPTVERQNPISDEELIRHYLRLSLPQFMESEFVLVANYLLGQILSFKSAVMKCRPLVNEHGTAVGDEIGSMTVEEVEALLREDEEDRCSNENDTSTTAKKFLKAVSASCRHLGMSAEAAKDARRKCFALQDFFGMHSLFITITIDDECSFRVRLYPYADANNEGTPLPPLDLSDADCIADLTLRRRIRKKYPGACALEFQSSMQIALECLFGWNPGRQRGKRGLFGIMEAFCRADEEQGRKSLHAHWLVWIKNFGHLRRLMFSEDDHKRELARANYIAYVNNVMCARQCAFEVEATCQCKRKGATDDIFDNRSAVIFREARHEQGCRLKDDDEGGPGRVMQCRGCGHITSPEEITASVLKNLQQEAPGNLHLPAFDDSFSSERLDIAAYRTIYDVPDGDGEDSDSMIRSILLNERFNQHSTLHASSCFKKGCECRFYFPFLASSGSKLDIAVADLMCKIIQRWQFKVQRRREEGKLEEIEDELTDEEFVDTVKSWLERLSDACDCDSMTDDECTFDREAAAVAEVAALIKREADKTDMDTAVMNELARSVGAFKEVTEAIAENKGTRIYEGKTPVEVTRHTLDGSTSRENRFVVDIHRPQGCQFMNVYNRVLSHLFTCNTNVAAGDSGQTWYQTLYNCKNTQSDDREPRDVVAKSVIRRLIRAQREKEEREQAGIVEEEEVNTWVEGLSRVLSGINAATSRNVVSAPMSHNLASNKGSRFHFSHQFAELLVGQLSDVLDSEREHNVSAIVRRCKENWKDISANDYIYRPDDLKALCCYHQSMYYTKLYKKDGLSETDKDDVDSERLTFKEGHPGIKFAYLSKLRRARIPKVSIPDGKLCRIEDLCINEKIDKLSKEVKDKREEYAKMALLMFCPFQGEDGLDTLRLKEDDADDAGDQKGSYWKKFDAFRIKYFGQEGYHSLTYEKKCEKEFLLDPSDFDLNGDKVKDQYLELNGDKSKPHERFWIKGFEILQNIEDRMSMEQCQGRATDVISDIAPFPEKYENDSGAKEKENGDDDLAKDIAFYCQLYEGEQREEESGNHVRPYTHKRLLDGNFNHSRIVEARLTSTTSNIIAVSENDGDDPTSVTTTASDSETQAPRDRKSYDTIIQLIQGSLLGGGNYDDVYSTGEMDVDMDVVPDAEGCAEDKPQKAAVPTLEDVARTVLREENKRLDEKQYIMYEVIACSFLLRLLMQEEENILVQSGVSGAIGQDGANDIERLKRALRERGGRDQLLMFVTGFAGAGKSTAIKVAQKFCYEFCKATSVMWADNTFLFTAYTGSAAAAFGGLTTVKATYIGKKGHTPNLTMDEEKAFEGVRILIIDEISFLSDAELLKLDRTLQRIGDRRKPFGGYSIIFSGDFQQNEPVRMKPSEKLWHPTSSRHFENNINCAIILDGIHRFRDDEAYGRILQRLCRGEMTEEDVDSINSRYVGAGGIQLPKKLDGDTCYACHTNKQRNAITAAIFQEHLKQTHPLAGDINEPPKHTIIIKGLIQSVTSSSANVGALRQRIIELGDNDLKQGTKLISPHLCCYVGAYFMCNSNENLKEHGTGNGTQARLVEVRLKSNPASYGCEVWDGRKVWTVCASDVEYVKFEHYPGKGELPRFFRLVPKKVSAMAQVLPHDRANQTVPMSCNVTQLPVNASDAITGHKLQGLTKDNVIVCSWNKTTNWIYVVLSRVRTLKGLYLFRKLKLSDIKPPQREYLAFLERMRVLQNDDLERARSRG